MVLGQFGPGKMAFRRPLARCFGPEHFKQPHAIGGLPPQNALDAFFARHVSGALGGERSL